MTSTRRPRVARRRGTRPCRSSTWCSTGRTMHVGSIRPVGRITCSTNTPPVRSSSQGPGVAETNTVCGRIASHSSNFSGRLSVHDGRRKPNSASVDLRWKSPLVHAAAAAAPRRGSRRRTGARSRGCTRTGSAAARPGAGRSGSASSSRSRGRSPVVMIISRSATVRCSSRSASSSLPVPGGSPRAAPSAPP